MHEAFTQLSSGRATVPVRMNLELDSEQGRALIMPAYSPDLHRLGYKLVSIMDKNQQQGLPLIQAMVLLFDATTGRALALMDGEHLTALRTGAASGLATDLLSRKNASVAAIIGTGVQARFQLEAICQVRTIQKVTVLGRNSARAERFAHEMSERLGLSVEVTSTPRKLACADIICTATTATAAVFAHENLRPGVHINAVGSYKPGMCEIPVATIVRAKVVVDHRESCLREAGDLIAPLKTGQIKPEHIHAELGEIAAGNKSGRESAEEITVFKSVGNAIQDLLAANHVLINAEKMNLGKQVEL